jgi:SOS-response transcriptional repressor LexA
MIAQINNDETLSEMTRLGKNITDLMHEKKMDAKKRGEGNPSLGVLVTLSNFFDISLDTLISSDPMSTDVPQSIPVYNLRYAQETQKHNPIQKIQLSCGKDEKLYSFAVQIDNSSLMPFFDKGSVFFISKIKQYTDGDMVLVRINNESNVIRKIFIQNQGHFFQHIALDTSPHKYDQYEIIGTIVKVIHNMSIEDEAFNTTPIR